MARTNLGPHVDLSTLTLENFRERMGRRFRMTRDQTERKLTREQAFQEFLAAARQPVQAAAEPSN